MQIQTPSFLACISCNLDHIQPRLAGNRTYHGSTNLTQLLGTLQPRMRPALELLHVSDMTPGCCCREWTFSSTAKRTPSSFWSSCRRLFLSSPGRTGSLCHTTSRTPYGITSTHSRLRSCQSARCRPDLRPSFPCAQFLAAPAAHECHAVCLSFVFTHRSWYVRRWQYPPVSPFSTSKKRQEWLFCWRMILHASQRHASHLFKEMQPVRFMDLKQITLFVLYNTVC